MSKDLPIPEAVRHDDAAIELVRIWAAGGQQHISIATAVWPDAAAWGILLVDLARNIARAYVEEEGADYADALSRIRQGLDAEWSTPTD